MYKILNTPLNPLLCGRWDGHTLWTQWTADSCRYAFRFRLRAPAKSEWGEWIRVEPVNGLAKAWHVLPVHRLGWDVSVQVARHREGELEWEDAKEVKFERARARFLIHSERRILRLQAGEKIGAVVDGAGCAYYLTEDLEVHPGSPVETTLEALHLSGYAQLDREKHFHLRPSLGVEIYNLSPSENDVSLTGRDFTTLESAPLGGPLVLIKA